MDYKAWLQQVTTIHGFMAIGGTIIAAGGTYAMGDHQAAFIGAAAGLVAGLIGLVMPDNTKLSADASAAVTSFVTDVQAKNQTAALADAFNGAIKILADIQAKLPVPALPTPAAAFAVAQPIVVSPAPVAAPAAANPAPAFTTVTIENSPSPPN